MAKPVKILVGLLLVCILGGSYWLGRVQGGRVGPGKSAATNLIKNVSIDATQKNKAGDLYGEFTVVVSMKNNTGKKVHQLKVICQQVHTSTQYPTAIPKVETKMLYLADIPAGEERTLKFTDFRVQHPEELQEIVVNVVGYSGLAKFPYKAVFPPNSKD